MKKQMIALLISVLMIFTGCSSFRDESFSKDRDFAVKLDKKYVIGAGDTKEQIESTLSQKGELSFGKNMYSYLNGNMIIGYNDDKATFIDITQVPFETNKGVKYGDTLDSVLNRHKIIKDSLFHINVFYKNGEEVDITPTDDDSYSKDDYDYYIGYGKEEIETEADKLILIEILYSSNKFEFIEPDELPQ